MISNIESVVLCISLWFMRNDEKSRTYGRAIISDKAFFGTNNGKNPWNGDYQLDIPVSDAYMEITKKGYTYHVDDRKKSVNVDRHFWIDMDPINHIDNLEYRVVVYENGRAVKRFESDKHQTLIRRANALKHFVNQYFKD